LTTTNLNPCSATRNVCRR